MAKPKLKYNKSFSCGTYPFYIMLSVNETDEELTAQIGSPPPPDDRDTCHAHTFQFPDGLILIRLYFHPRNAFGYSVLSHEIFHAIEYLMGHAGIPHCRKTSEAWAYAVSDISKKLFGEVLRKSKAF